MKVDSYLPIISIDFKYYNHVTKIRRLSTEFRRRDD
jgi:hypothetical protein